MTNTEGESLETLAKRIEHLDQTVHSVLTHIQPLGSMIADTYALILPVAQFFGEHRGALGRAAGLLDRTGKLSPRFRKAGDDGG